MSAEKVVYDPATMRFNQGGRIHQDIIKCPFCHKDTMKLVEDSAKKKTYKCTECGTLMSEDK